MRCRWRWIYWVNIPLALLAFPLVLRFIKPDRPAQPLPLRIDWVGVTLVVAWIVSVHVHLGLVSQVGRLDIQRLHRAVLIALILPFLLVAWVGAGLAVASNSQDVPGPRLRLGDGACVLLLMQLLAVFTLMAKYCVDVREYPRAVAGWVLAPATFSMAVSTFLTTWFHRRGLRHFWLLVGVVGCAACLWWMSSVDNFTSKGRWP